MDKGQEIKNLDFVMNLDQPSEKMLHWNYKTGFQSEDSDNEVTDYRRLER